MASTAAAASAATAALYEVVEQVDECDFATVVWSRLVRTMMRVRRLCWVALTTSNWVKANVNGHFRYLCRQDCQLDK